MTARRLSSAVALTVVVAVTVMLSGAAAAEPVTGEANDDTATLAPSEAPAMAGAASDPARPGANAPDASAAEAPPALRPWLRDTRKLQNAHDANQASVSAQPDASPWRSVAVVLVLAGLGLAALGAKKYRAKDLVLPESETRVRVLSSARIGPKANAVVAEVAGRVILLGVTDSGVSRLAWLDAPAAKRAARTDGRRPRPESRIEVTPVLSREPVETADADEEEPDVAPERSMASRFGEVFNSALGVRGPSMGTREKREMREFRANPGVAALLAADVEDVVRTPQARPRASAPIVNPLANPRQIVEDQVAGLSARRRRS